MIIIIVLIIFGGLYFIRKINHDKMENFKFRRRFTKESPAIKTTLQQDYKDIVKEMNQR